MRRSVIWLIVCIGCSPWAVAAPREQLSNRLQGYEVAVERPAPRRGSTVTVAARYQQDPRTAARPVRRTSYQPDRLGNYHQIRRAQYQEGIPPGDVVEGPVSQGPVGGDFHHDLPWDHHGDPYYGDSCGGCGGCGDCCGDYWDDCCGDCLSGGFWGRAEYLYWWVRGSDTPPLVTTSPINTPQSDAGVLPDATVLFGDKRLNETGRSGGRFTLGYWFCGFECPTGIDATFLFLGETTDTFHATSGGSPILARPFFNVLTQQQDANLIAFPNIVTGAIKVDSTSNVYAGDVNLRRTFAADCWKQIDILAGYRFLHLQENLGVVTDTTSIDPNGGVPVGTTFAIFDSFNTQNNFNGGQLGINVQCTNGCWTLDFLGKLALGSVSQRVAINGGTVRNIPNVGTDTFTGGILALDSNIGTYRRNRFGILPEFGVDLRYQLTPLWRLNLGYTLLVLTNVVRPGDQIDLSLDPNQFPPSLGGSQPRFTFQDSDVWLQGISFGVECNF